MPDLTWPSDIPPTAFGMQLVPTVRRFSATFGGSNEDIDMADDYWRIAMSAGFQTGRKAARLETLVSRLAGGTKFIQLGHMVRPVPNGSLRNIYTLALAAAKGSDQLVLGTDPGVTLLAGDVIGIDGMLLMVRDDALADAGGRINVYAVNKLRRALAPSTRASTGTYLDSSGVLRTAAVDEPRQNWTSFASNLLTQSGLSAGLTDTPVNAGLVSSSTFAAYPLEGAVAFGSDGATNSWAYKSFPFLGALSTAVYNLSCYVETTDGLPPLMHTDLRLNIGGQLPPGPSSYLVQDEGDGVYRVSASSVGIAAPSNNHCGVTRYGVSSDRTFKVSGYQLSFGEVLQPYVSTTTAAAKLGLSAEWLVEPARTNSIAQSQNLALTPWTGCSRTLAAEFWAGNVPFYECAKLLTAQEPFTSGAVVVVAGETWTLTLALLAGTKTTCSVGLYGTVTGPNGFWGEVADCTKEIISGPGTFTPYSGVAGGLWHVDNLHAYIPTLVRITRTFTATMSARLYGYPGRTSSVTVGDSIKATRVQLEKGADDTSYIPTTTAAVTRAADIALPATADHPTARFISDSASSVNFDPNFSEDVSLSFVEAP